MSKVGAYPYAISGREFLIDGSGRTLSGGALIVNYGLSDGIDEAH